MPVPSQINRYWRISEIDAFSNSGYQCTGVEITRPSSSSTCRWRSSIWTDLPLKPGIPTLQKIRLMTLHNTQTLPQFLILESAVLYCKRRQLNLSPTLALKYMHVCRRVIICIKEELETIQEQ